MEKDPTAVAEKATTKTSQDALDLDAGVGEIDLSDLGIGLPGEAAGNDRRPESQASPDEYSLPDEFQQPQQQSSQEDDEPEGNSPEDIQERKRRNDSLRQNLKQANEDLRSANAELEALRAEKRERERETEDLRKQIDSERRTREMSVDPSEHPEVRRLADGFNNELASVAQDMDLAGDGNGRVLIAEIGRLVTAYRNLGRMGDQGYEDRESSFRNTLRAKFGSSASQALAMVKKAADIHSQVQEKASDIANNRSKYLLQEERRRYEDLKSQMRDVHERWGRADEEFMEQHPDHPTTIVAAAMAEDDALKEKGPKILSWLQYVTLPLRPLSDEQIQSNSPEELERLKKQREEHHFREVKRYGAQIGEAFLARELLPKLREENEALKARLGGQAVRRGTAQEQESRQGGARQSDNLAEYEPEPISLEGIFQ